MHRLLWERRRAEHDEAVERLAFLIPSMLGPELPPGVDEITIRVADPEEAARQRKAHKAVTAMLAEPPAPGAA